MKKTAFIPIVSCLLLSACNYDFTDYDYEKAVIIKLNGNVAYRYFPGELKLGIDWVRGIVIGDKSYKASLDEKVSVNIKTSYMVKNIETLSYVFVDNSSYEPPVGVKYTEIDPIRKRFRFDLSDISDELNDYKITYYDYPVVSFLLRVEFIDKTYASYKFFIEIEE